MAKAYEKERQLQGEIAEAVERSLPEVEVLAVELGGPDRMTVYIDHPRGVDHALCAQVTDVLSDYLEHYTLDVSSPGFERPLRAPKHFAGVIGRRVSLRTNVELAGRKRFRGEVVSVDDRAVGLATGDERVDVPYEAIVRGNLIDEGR